MRRLLLALLLVLQPLPSRAEEARIKGYISLRSINERPLDEVLQSIASQTGLTLAFDNVDVKSPVTCSLSSITADRALELILEPLGLTHEVTGAIVLITRGGLPEVTYQVADLVTFQGSDPTQPPDLDALVELITTTIKPQSWSEVGGPGTIQTQPGRRRLVVRHSKEVHAEIAALFAKMRVLGPQQQKALMEKVTISFKREPLANVLAEIASQSGLNIHLSPAVARDRGILPSVPMSIEVKDRPAGEVLSSLLAPLELKTQSVKDAIVVTTPREIAESGLSPASR